MQLTSSTTVGSSTARTTAYKFNRKNKSTTELPSSEVIIKPTRRPESSSLVKKVRPASFSRRNKTTSNTETSMADNDKTESSIEKNKSTLPKTSYYSRLRNKSRNEASTSTTEASIEVIKVETTVESKKDNPVDMPLIFSLLKSPTPTESETSVNGIQEKKEPGKGKKMFIIAVTSKETQEQSTENEVSSRSEEIVNIVSSDEMMNSKFHATYKNHTAVNSSKNKGESQEVTPSIRNIRTRKYSRQRTATANTNEEASEATPRSRERNLRKFSDTYSKTTEASTNGVSKNLTRAC